ncbi:ATPase [Dinoroseobacter sp. PD6]|uniref:ATP12 family chaperone protein n=1 Tax=Dinoroseobacter sp. PD6 TaxID=3028384 RepID=UPI00237AE302|nr:ATP12 family protein [Dinoroseobacter sp. PD6]MDD9718859.1 ATPase [Dinoroseobacter sp. PD6]
MSGWAAKRFWKETDIVEAGTGFEVRLDGRSVRTPLKTLLVVPSRGFAERIAAEWDAQDETVNPQSMPFTRAANAALDKVTPQHAEVAEMLSAYGGTDLLCYRATGPDTLCARQAESWDPLLDWAAERYGARLRVTAGVLPVDQDADSLARLSQAVAAFTPFQLTGFHDLVAISGSLVLGLAVAEGRMSAEAGFAASRIDEEWQISQWGDDEEEAERIAVKRADYLRAKEIFDLS